LHFEITFPDKELIELSDLSILKTEKPKAIRFNTLEAICEDKTANQVTFWNM